VSHEQKKDIRIEDVDCEVDELANVKPDDFFQFVDDFHKHVSDGDREYTALAKEISDFPKGECGFI
jgi:hypothetical protein